ncbi:MAG: PAS domain S-box protein [Solirubrobacteraceae bacterium]
MARSQLFTNHLHVLAAIVQQPDLRLREIAHQIGITERAAHRIVNELAADGYVTRTRIGARNHYEVQPEAIAREPRHAAYHSQLNRLLAAANEAVATPGRLAPEPTATEPTANADESDLFHAMFAAAPAGIVLADQSGRVLKVNPAFCQLLERREDELVGRHFRDFTHPDDIQEDEAARAALADGNRSHFVRDKRYLLANGAPVWVKFRVAATTCPDTGARLYVAHVVDITDRKRKDRELAEAEDRFRSAFDNAPIGMALVAPDGRWLKVNRSLCELTGYAEIALLVRSFQSITHPDDLDADLALVQEVLAGKRRTYQMQKRYYHADGHVIWVTLSVSLVRDANARPLYFVSQIEDITERKQREQALQDHVEQLTAQPPSDQTPSSNSPASPGVVQPISASPSRRAAATTV